MGEAMKEKEVCKEIDWQESPTSIIQHWVGLNTRFQYLVDLRTTTARRHISITGATGGFIALVFKGETPETTMYYTVMISALVIMALGACVVYYDAQIRARSMKVAKEIERLVLANGLTETGTKPNLELSEDFWFFSQTIVVNSVAATFFFSAIMRIIDSPPVITFAVLLATFISFILLQKRFWDSHFRRYYTQINNWTNS